MVFKKIKELKKKYQEKNDEKYEILYHKYSQLKSENLKLKNQINEEKKELKDKIINKIVEMLLNLEDDVEEMKNSSFKVSATSKEIQRLLVDINKVEKTLGNILNKLNVEPIVPKERFYDPELHEVSSYTPGRNLEKGIILKTVKKGWKYKNKIVRKPKVLVTQ